MLLEGHQHKFLKSKRVDFAEARKILSWGFDGREAGHDFAGLPSAATSIWSDTADPVGAKDELVCLRLGKINRASART